MLDKLQEYIVLSKSIKELEEKRAELKKDIINLGGENFTLENFKVYTYIPKRFNSKKFKEENPSLYIKYTEESSPITCIKQN